MSQPSETGKVKYAPDGYYTANRNEKDPTDLGTPCTCKPECQYNCKGQCGCEACREGYGDYLSSQGD